jgi:phosphonate transport system substrate-binding protein
MNLRTLVHGFVAATALLAGCSTLAVADDGAEVDFENRAAIPAVGSIEPQPLRIAVASVLSPEGTVESYSELAQYLGEQLGRPVELVQRRTYAEVNELIASGEVDIAFVCTSAYILGHEAGAMDLLVVPEIRGARVYHSSIIVPASSTASSMADLRGTMFAFTDPMSLTGRVYPTFLVNELDESVESFFSEIVFTYSHDRAVAAVAAGVVDGAGVDDIVLQNLLAKDPSLAQRIRVIASSPDFGMPPVVVPSDTPASVRALFEGLLVNLEFDESGPRILATLGVDRFVHSSDDAYEEVRVLMTNHAEYP